MFNPDESLLTRVAVNALQLQIKQDETPQHAKNTKMWIDFVHLTWGAFEALARAILDIKIGYYFLIGTRTCIFD